MHLCLSLLVFLHIGTFRFDNYHGDPHVYEAEGLAFDVIPLPNLSPSYMGFGGSSKLTLELPQDISPGTPLVPILDITPSYTLIPLNQYYPWPLQAPYFYQDGNVYFVRSREDFEWVSIQVAKPEKVTPAIGGKRVSWKDFDIRRDLGRPGNDPLMEKAVVGPWISAERQIAPQKLKSLGTQTGLGV
jgi:hypothetical protein